VTEAFGGKVPGILAQQLGNGTKYATLHHHPLVEFVVAVQLRHPLDGKPVEDDAAFGNDDPPAVNGPPVPKLRRQTRDLEAYVRELRWPDVAKVLGGRGNSRIELVDPSSKRRKMWASNRGSDATTVAVSPAEACRTRGTATRGLGHDSILRRGMADPVV